MIRRQALHRLSLLAGVSALPQSGFALATPNPMILSIDGPLIVTNNLPRQRELFEGVFGLSLVSDQELDGSTVNALFGVTGRTARTVLLETRGTSVGVRLVEFRPSSAIAVRERARPIDADALKVIDFMVPDFDKAVASLALRGFKLAGPPAEYSVPPDGRFTEGHIEGPDGITCALLKMHQASPGKYVRVTDRIFSEILGVSGPVSDRNAAIAFYQEVLGLETVVSYEIENESFQKLLGSKEKTLLRGANFGLDSRAPMMGVIHYGLPPSAFSSLREVSVLPNRGLQAIRLSAKSVGSIARKASAAGIEILVPPTETVLFPQGRVKSLLIRAPHGVIHHFTETITP